MTSFPPNVSRSHSTLVSIEGCSQQLSSTHLLGYIAWVSVHSGKPNSITNRAEEYLETILNMTIEGQEVVAARLAERLEVSAPTVSAALGRLKRDELVDIKDTRISLTDVGYREAVRIIRRHRLVERLLIDYLGIDWADVHEEACLLEHAISPLVEERLYERLGRPETCPHGNPIPAGSKIDLPECEPLSTQNEGAVVDIVRVTEEVSDNHEMMKFLQDNSLTPGSRYRISASSRPAGTLTLETLDRDHSVVLAINVAEALFVATAEAVSTAVSSGA